jgi:23S rRNA pseudouridine2604 synthase
MARPTLKLPPKSGPAGPARPLTSRARRAQHGRSPTVPLSKGATLAAPPAAKAIEAPPRPKPGPAPRAKTGAAAGATPRPKAGAPRWSKPGEAAGAQRQAKAGTRRWSKPDEAIGSPPRANAGAPPASRTHPTPGPASGAPPHAKRRDEFAPRAKPAGKPAFRGPRKPATDVAAPPAARESTPRASATPLAPEHPRLSKLMSERGICSRREADEWIENGWVKVDGVVVATLGTRVSPAARIDVDPAAKRHQSEQVTILLNKPPGYVSGQPEDGYPPAMVLLRPENRWPGDRSPQKFKATHLRGLAPAGRLDIDSTGLLVFTQDGRVARRLVGDKSEVEKEYLVRVEGALAPQGMKLLQHGLELDGVKLRPAHVSWQNESQLRIVLREGRKRQIRRMCELVGLKVTALKRIRSGSVSLGPLPEGQWRYLRADERF